MTKKRIPGTMLIIVLVALMLPLNSQKVLAAGEVLSTVSGGISSRNGYKKRRQPLGMGHQ